MFVCVFWGKGQHDKVPVEAFSIDCRPYQPGTWNEAELFDRCSAWLHNLLFFLVGPIKSMSWLVKIPVVSLYPGGTYFVAVCYGSLWWSVISECFTSCPKVAFEAHVKMFITWEEHLAWLWITQKRIGQFVLSLPHNSPSLPSQWMAFNLLGSFGWFKRIEQQVESLVHLSVSGIESKSFGSRSTRSTRCTAWSVRGMRSTYDTFGVVRRGSFDEMPRGVPPPRGKPQQCIDWSFREPTNHSSKDATGTGSSWHR